MTPLYTHTHIYENTKKNSLYKYMHLFFSVYYREKSDNFSSSSRIFITYFFQQSYKGLHGMHVAPSSVSRQTIQVILKQFLFFFLCSFFFALFLHYFIYFIFQFYLYACKRERAKVETSNFP